MTGTDLKYEIENYYDQKTSSFRRNPKFITKIGQIYSPLDLVGEDEISVDVGGSDRQIFLSPHLNDLLISLE